MKINPDTWSSASSVAKAFIREHYAHEIDIFDQVADIIKQRLIALDWSFELDSEADAGALGFGAKSLDTASALISLAVPILMSELPISRQPDPDKIKEVAEEVSTFCGAPNNFTIKFKSLAQQIYALGCLPDSQVSFEVCEYVSKKELGIPPHRLSASEIEQDIENATNADSDYDLVLRIQPPYRPTIYIRNRPKSMRGPVARFTPVKLSSTQATFLQQLLLLEGAKASQEQLEEACGVHGAQRFHDLKSKMIARIEEKTPIKGDIWLRHRIRSIFQIDPPIPYCLYERVMEKSASS